MDVYKTDDLDSLKRESEEWKAKLEPYVDKKVTFGLRPEDIGTDEAEKAPGMPRVKAKIEVVEPMGSETYVYLNTGENTFIARVDPHKRLRVGELESLAVLLPKAHFFDGETEKTIIWRRRRRRARGSSLPFPPFPGNSRCFAAQPGLLRDFLPGKWVWIRPSGPYLLFLNNSFR